MRTLTVKQGGDFVDRFPPGWHTLEICKAEYGQFNDSKFIDLWFKEYEDVPKLSCRIWAKKGKTGEEFAIGRLFRFANAGITQVSKSDEGDAVITIDDSPSQLLGKKINVFFYKKEDSGYTEILPNIAPTVFSNDIDNFKEDDVNFWKRSAEKYYKSYVVNKKDSDSDFGMPRDVSEIPKNGASATEDSMPW